MASQELDNDFYEPSQLMEELEGLENRSRPSRSAHIGTRRTRYDFYNRCLAPSDMRNSALFQPGGALDSQTSDSQWASSFDHDASLFEGR